MPLLPRPSLISVYINSSIQWIAGAILRNAGSFMGRWIGKVLFRISQCAAERQHARMRHDLLKMDEQLGESLAFTGRPE